MDKQKGSIGDPQIIYKNMGGREGEREIKRGRERERISVFLHCF